jgi:hypothetical protein
MPWFYKLFVVEADDAWALEIEDAANLAGIVRHFTSADAALARARALRRQLDETGDVAEIFLQDAREASGSDPD